MDVPARLSTACLATVVSLLIAAPALAQTAGSSATLKTDPNALTRPLDLTQPPIGRRLSAKQAIAIADRVKKVQREKRRVPGATASAFLKGATRWQVSYYTPRTAHEIAQVSVDDLTGQVLEAWTGYQVAWTMARGYSGAFGRKVNAPYVWIPLCLLFILPFIDPRRPFRLLHLDLLVLVGFSVSLYFFNRARIGLSVPLAYPPLLYLLGRMLAIGLRRSQEPREPLRLLVPVTWLAVGAVFLLGFRIGLNVTNSNVIDVGYAGVIGADRIADGDRLYGDFPQNNDHGDTYGPVNYVAYVPFEQAKPWSGAWDDLPAAHGAAIAFDVLVAAGLWLLGRRVRGPTLGVVLAYAWLAFPFSLYVMNTNANDALVAALILAAVLVATSAPARGALAGLASLTKFAPVALAPLLATYRGGRRGRAALRAAFAAAVAVAMIPVRPARRQPAHVLRPHHRLPERPRLAVLGLGAVGRPRHGPDRREDRGAGARGRPRPDPAPARRDRAVRAVRRGADRAPARRDALVLPLHRLVRPARAGRALRALPRARAGLARARAARAGAPARSRLRASAPRR